MNPLLLLLGLFGTSAFAFGGKSNTSEAKASNVDDDNSNPGMVPDKTSGDTDGGSGGSSDDDSNGGSGDNSGSQTTFGIALVAYDANGNVVQRITDGETFDFGTKDVSGYMVGAEVTGDGFQSVLFEVEGQVFVQNLPPYNMPAETVDFSEGTHTIKVTAHSGFNGEGELLASETISFETTATVPDDNSDDSDDQSGDDGGDTTGDQGGTDTDGDDTGNSDQGNDDETPMMVGITLVAYDSNGAVAEEIDNGESLDFGADDVSGYMLGAEIAGTAQSVLFEIDGEVFVQNLAPYNTPAGAIDFSDGNHTVKVTAHSGFNGEGALLGTETFTFDTTATVTDDTDGGMDHGDGGMDHGGGDDDGGMDHGGGDTGGDDGGMDHGDGDHGGHNSTPDIPPPGVGASQSAINAFVDALAAAPEVHVHDNMSSAKGTEHTAAMELVERGDATHVAIGSGDWSDPNIWSNGEVPGDGAKVLIPDGVTVDYGTVSEARLFTVRVDGKIDFATDTNSQMIFDTFVVTPTGHLEIGTANDPVDPNVDIDLIVANNGPIDTNWDPMLLSRGLISHGTATIHGAEKDSHDKVTDDPMEGDTSVKMAGGVPTGWQVGDTIVIAGTHFEGYHWSAVDQRPEYSSEDEVRVISQIDNNGTIWFDEPLEHDHDAPRDDLSTSVANYTRNISIETENAETAEVFERGHVMFMHSDNVDVRYVEFHELGRTDKSEEANAVEDIDNIRFDSNVQGRYSVHLHRTGVEDLENPAILEGNSVFGSPGWGFVHHDSNALLTNNASFDTFGAGYVAETGNETGAWVDNIAIFAEGTSWAIPKNTADTEDDLFDTAKGGDGFWFQGRMVGSVDNVAASVNTGFVYFHRDGNDTMINIDAAEFAYPGALYYIDEWGADHAPILSFDGNEVFAAREGLHVVKSNPNQDHDVHSHLDNFTAWSVVNGAHLEYTSHYILTNFDVVGNDGTGTPYWNADTGISIGNNTSDLTIINANVEGFKIGIDLNHSFNDTSISEEYHDYTVVDATFSDVDIEYAQYDPSIDTITTASDLPFYDPDIEIDGTLYWDDGDNRELYITGTKTDSLGVTDYPDGIDRIRITREEMTGLLENNGYWTTSGGERYTLVDLYFTDRYTGEVYYETQPIYIGPANLGAGRYSDAIDNGTQNLTTVNGVKMAGDTPLGVTQSATPITMQSQTASATMIDHTAHETLAAMVADEDMDAMEALAFDIGDGELFVNTTDAADIDLTATGGSTVLATGGAEFDLSEGRTLTVFEAVANVGFDGDDGGTAILDMQEGSTVAFAAEDGDLGTIEEFSSGAYGDEPNVQSGIDLGNATLSIDLTGLTAESGTAFTLMDADEIVGIFEEAIVGGLGAQNAKIVVDYENDSVSLQLSAGDGAVEVETLGAETDVTSGEEALWAALTADQGIHSEHDMGTEGEDEDDLLGVAA